MLFILIKGVYKINLRASFFYYIKKVYDKFTYYDRRLQLKT